MSFASTRKAWAYLEDSRSVTTHPIVARVDDVEAARQAFDGITYAKGAAVLKQLVAHVGQEAFLEASGRLFERRAYGNATLEDFLEVLSQVSGRDMHDWARAWLHTAGPSVISDELVVNEGRIVSLTLRQEGTDLATGEPVLRPHTLVVGLYSLDEDGALVRTHRLPVTMEAEQVEVPEAVGMPAPDVVLVNDEDLTYAVVRPDDDSLSCLATSLGSVRDPWPGPGMVDAAQPSAGRLHRLTAVRGGRPGARRRRHRAGHPGHATEPGTASSQPVQRPQDTSGATGQAPCRRPDEGPGRLCASPRARWLGQAVCSCAGLGLPARARTRLVGGRRTGGRLSQQSRVQVTDRIRLLLNGGLPGLEPDADLRWRALTALARLDAVGAGELAAQRSGPDGQRHHPLSESVQLGSPRGAQDGDLRKAPERELPEQRPHRRPHRGLRRRRSP